MTASPVASMGWTGWAEDAVGIWMERKRYSLTDCRLCVWEWDLESGRNLTSTIVSTQHHWGGGGLISWDENARAEDAARLCYIPGDLDAFTKYSRNVERDRWMCEVLALRTGKRRKTKVWTLSACKRNLKPTHSGAFQVETSSMCEGVQDKLSLQEEREVSTKWVARRNVTTPGWGWEKMLERQCFWDCQWGALA